MTTLNFSNLISWSFGIIFLILGVLNLFLVHPIPGLFYMIFSLLFYPPMNSVFRNKFGLTFPFVLKVIIGLVLLWATLAVGDLAEMYGL